MNISLKKSFEFIATSILTFGLIVQFFIIKERVDVDGMTWFSSIKMSFLYMTIWTNILVCVTFWNLLLNRKNLLTRHSSMSAILVYILIVGIVYHFALAHLWNPTGKLWITDKIFHYCCPVMFTTYWLFFLPKERLPYQKSLIWLWYPVVYAMLTLVHGLLTKQYPYPIFNLETMPVVDVLRNTMLTYVTYLVFGVIVITVNNFLLSLQTGDIQTQTSHALKD